MFEPTQLIRRGLRQQRQKLTPQQRHGAAISISQQAIRLPNYQQAETIAFYLASDGELDPEALLIHAVASNKACYLPVVQPEHKLQFHQYLGPDLLQTNRYGIQEPTPSHCPMIEAKHLDIVFVPLVGFDQRGNRLGMGGGYYDRCFAFRQQQTVPPLLIGLTFDCQAYPNIPNHPWDVALDGVITPGGFIAFKEGALTNE